MNAMRYLTFAVLCATAGLALRSHAYEIDTHRVLTQAAANRSVLQLDLTQLRDMGLEKSMTDQAQRFPNSKNKLRTIRELLEDGADFEDNISLQEVRVTKHFYNPLTSAGLRAGVFQQEPTSPDWALAPRGSNPEQQYSYGDARQYLYDALTKPVQAERERAFGLTFQTLGQVMHHLQDMAQPQHVRNDAHCPSLGCILLGVGFAPSLFEVWTDQRDIRGALPVNPGPVGYDITSPAFATTFNSPRRFWHTEPPGPNSPQAGKGLAEFTNRNFVSAGTNFDQPRQPAPPYFALPAFDPTNKSDITVAQLCAGANPPCPPAFANLPQAKITFYGTTGRDNFTGANVVNPKASSESIFTQYLEPLPEDVGRVYALNRFNFDEAYKQLIPRAVAYSAGLINHFFRGKIDIVPDASNLGSHLIKNLGTEPMSGKFALYYDRADGTRHPVPDASGNDLVWDTKVVLANNGGVLGPNGEMPAAGFVVPADAKTSAEYLLVFAGDLGEEKADEANGGVGAVAARFIPAPSGGTLYIAALDANNRYVGLRVDRSGTRIISSSEYDPLLPVVRGYPIGFSDYYYYVTPKAHALKQVAFRQTLNGWDYQTLAVAFRTNPYWGTMPGLVWNAVSNKYDVTYGPTWLAEAPDSATGKFRFQLAYNDYSRQYYLSYVRSLMSADGQPRSESGTAPMPAELSAHQLSNAEYQGYPVSQDGRQFGEFLFESTTRNPPNAPSYQWTTEKKYYELRIELGDAPTVRLELVTQSTDTGTVQAQFSDKYPFGLISMSAAARRTERGYIGHMNGEKRVYSSVIDFTASGDFGQGSAQSDYWPNCPLRPVFPNYREEAKRIDQFSVGVLNSVNSCDASVGRVISGKQIYRGLSENADDAIYTSGPAASWNQYFQGVSLGNLFESAIYIAEASPRGEVFVAKPDLSVVIHEPLPGGMPKIAIPPNIKKLLAAVWM